ncbi:MAG: MOFRL family protein, partial [Pseudomonadota bacterium]
SPGRGTAPRPYYVHRGREISGDENLQILVAGTDGTDGPTDAAGALVDGTTWDPSGANALARADAYPWLSAKEALVKTGPTGTNVMDLMLALRS